MTEAMDRSYSTIEIQDRFAIADLYDRQLAAAEAHDWTLYDTTFSPQATIDLSDFGEPLRRYPDYRRWLEEVSQDMPKALRISGGLRLDLQGDRATTRVPVLCLVKMRRPSGLDWTWTALCYNDALERTDPGWRIVRRYEELVYPDEAGPGRA